jgi:hypothetical protein
VKLDVWIISPAFGSHERAVIGFVYGVTDGALLVGLMGPTLWTALTKMFTTTKALAMATVERRN